MTICVIQKLYAGFCGINRLLWISLNGGSNQVPLFDTLNQSKGYVCVNIDLWSLKKAKNKIVLAFNSVFNSLLK